jgi:hypothetical protein
MEVEILFVLCFDKLSMTKQKDCYDQQENGLQKSASLSLLKIIICYLKVEKNSRVIFSLLICLTDPEINSG